MTIGGGPGERLRIPIAAHDWLAARVPSARGATAAFVAAGFVFSALVYVPTVSLFEPYHNQWGVDRGLTDFVAARGIDRGIVFVGPEKNGYFGRALLLNASLPPTGDLIYAFENGPLDDTLIRRSPGRPVFHYHPGRRRPPLAALDEAADAHVVPGRSPAVGVDDVSGPRGQYRHA